MLLTLAPTSQVPTNQTNSFLPGLKPPRPARPFPCPQPPLLRKPQPHSSSPLPRLPNPPKPPTCMPLMISFISPTRASVQPIRLRRSVTSLALTWALRGV